MTTSLASCFCRNWRHHHCRGLSLPLLAMVAALYLDFWAWSRLLLHSKNFQHHGHNHGLSLLLLVMTAAVYVNFWTGRRLRPASILHMYFLGDPPNSCRLHPGRYIVECRRRSQHAAFHTEGGRRSSDSLFVIWRYSRLSSSNYGTHFSARYIQAEDLRVD